MRVVSLLPSATEIVYALGVEPVAVSHECDHPPAAGEKPAVNRSRVDPDASSAEINEQVADAEERGGVYEIDHDALARADPDLVVTQGICDVCAVDAVLVERAVDDLGLDCEILTTDPHSLDEVLEDVERIGRAVGRKDRAADLVAELRDRVDRVRDRTAGVPAAERPRVAVLDWMDPVMTAGHWVPEMVEIAGGQWGFDAERSVPREWSEIRDYDPDVLVAAPCGFDLEQTVANLDDLADRPGWTDLAAVRDGRTYAVDGHHLLNRPGPRLVDSLEYLAAVIHPGRFDAPPTSMVRRLERTVA